MSKSNNQSRRLLSRKGQIAVKGFIAGVAVTIAGFGTCNIISSNIEKLENSKNVLEMELEDGQTFEEGLEEMLGVTIVDEQEEIANDLEKLNEFLENGSYGDEIKDIIDKSPSLCLNEVKRLSSQTLGKDQADMTITLEKAEQLWFAHGDSSKDDSYNVCLPNNMADVLVKREEVINSDEKLDKKIHETAELLTMTLELSNHKYEYDEGIFTDKIVDKGVEKGISK